MPRPADTEKPDGLHWGKYLSVAELPNTAGAAVQTSHLDTGDLASVSGTMYRCTAAAEGAAAWALVGAVGEASLELTSGPAGTQSYTDTALKITGFDTVGYQQAGITASASTDSFTVTSAGEYEAKLFLSFTGTNATVYTVSLAVDDVVTKTLFIQKLATGADVASSGGEAMLALSAGAVVSYYFAADGAADFIMQAGYAEIRQVA